MKTRDPKRLLDHGIPELDAPLRAALERVPDDAAIERMAAKLGIPAGTSTPPSATGGRPSTSEAPGQPATPSLPPPVGGAKLLALKGAIGVAVLIAGAIGAWQLMNPHPEIPRSGAPSGTSASERAPAPAAATGLAPAQPAATTFAPTEASPIAPSQALPAAPLAEAPPSVKARARSELELIADAEHALRSNPRQALLLAAEHARLFPRGELAQEREVLTIEALVRTGQKDRARARLEAFRRTYPSSPHARRLESLFRTSGSTPDAGR
jgi:hypothetical protein